MAELELRFGGRQLASAELDAGLLLPLFLLLVFLLYFAYLLMLPHVESGSQCTDPLYCQVVSSTSSTLVEESPMEKYYNIFKGVL